MLGRFLSVDPGGEARKHPDLVNNVAAVYRASKDDDPCVRRYLSMVLEEDGAGGFPRKLIRRLPPLALPAVAHFGRLAKAARPVSAFSGVSLCTRPNREGPQMRHRLAFACDG